MKNTTHTVGSTEISSLTASGLSLLPAVAFAVMATVGSVNKTPYQEIMNTTGAPLRLELSCLPDTKKCDPMVIILPSMNTNTVSSLKSVSRPHRIDRVVMDLPGNEIQCTTMTTVKDNDPVLEKMGIKGAPIETIRVISCDTTIGG